MCYKCEICDSVAPARQPMERYIVYRNGPNVAGQIQKEIKVCLECKDNLRGFPLSLLLKQRGVVKRDHVANGETYAPPPPPIVKAKVKPLRAVEVEIVQIEEPRGRNGNTRKVRKEAK